MTYPGPWLQGDDYERSPEYNARGEAVGWRGNSVWTDPNTTPQPPFNDEMNNALDTLPGSITSNLDLALGGEIELTLIAPPTWRARQTSAGAWWDAADVLDVDWYWLNVLAVQQPPDAVGVEFEASSATAVGGLLHLVFTDGSFDGTAPNAALNKIAGAVDLTVGSQSFSWMATKGNSPAVFDIDITNDMTPGTGEVHAFVEVSKAGSWAYSNPTRTGLVSASTAMSGLTRVTYTVHPPRHRWLYETPPVETATVFGIPPLRQVQRGDGLGFSSAPRAIQNNSVQGSLRNFGFN